jgi:WD40 repeat protein
MIAKRAVSVVAAPASPFKGLAPFVDSDVDAMLFFGRARETEVIAANLQASRLTVLFGPSGVGKSSVLQAGVAHRLRQEPDVTLEIVDNWAGDSIGAIREALEARPDDGDLYLILDQFEEYFIYRADEPELPQLLGEVIAERGLRVNLLIGIRDDALARLDGFRAPVPNLLANRLQLDKLDRAAAYSAITGPIERYNELTGEGIEIEPELVEAVLDEVSAGRVDLGRVARGGVEAEGRDLIEAPYLQLVLERIWETEREAGSSRLRLETLRELGGAERMVERHLERAMAELSPREKDAAAAMYHFLVTPSGMKIAHGVSDLAGYAGVDEREAGAVLGRLTTDRIVRATSANGAARYEIFHDVLADAVLGWRNRHELERERNEARRKHRRAVFVAGASLVGLAVMAVIAIFAWTQRSHAKHEARVALARELTASSFLNLNTDPELSLLLAREAVRRERSPAVESVLRTALTNSHARTDLRPPSSAVLPGGTPATGIVVNAAGTRVIITLANGTAPVFDPTTGARLYTLSGGGIDAAAFGPHGGLVATAGKDGLIRLWNVHDGRPLKTFSSRTQLTGVALTPDSRLVAAGGADGAVHVWNIQGGVEARFVIGGRVSMVAFSPDSRLLVATSGETAWLFDLGAGRLRAKLQQGGRITSVTFSPNGGLLATPSLDHTIGLWHTDTGRRFRRLRERSAVFDAAFSPGGKLIATANSDGGARVYEVKRGIKFSDFVGHANYVTTIAFSPDGKQVVTASRDGTARVWEVETGRQLSVLAGHHGPVLDAIWSRGGHSVITGGVDGTARVWDPTTEPHLALVGREGSPIRQIHVLPDGGRVLSLTENGRLRLWRLAPHKLLMTFRPSGRLVFVSVSADGRLVVGAGSDGVAYVWRTDDGRRVARIGQGEPLVAAHFSPDGRRVVTAGRRGSAAVWRVAGGERLLSLQAGVPLNDAVFSPDGRLVVAGGRHGVVLLWDAKTGTLRKRFPRQPGSVTIVRFSPDGRVIVTAGTDSAARLWDPSGTLLATLRKHRAALTDAEFSRDGRFLLTASLDHDAVLWDIATRAPKVLPGHSGLVSMASFSPDGRWALTAGPGSAGLIETRSGTRIFLLRGHTTVLTGALFAPDGKTIVTGSLDGTIRTYFCDVCGGLDDLVALADRRLGRTHRQLTAAERAQYLGGN